MALTDVQKMKLDAIFSRKLVDMVGHGYYSLNDILGMLMLDDEMDFDLKLQSLPSCIDRVFSNDDINSKYHLHRFYGDKNMYEVTLEITLKKEKNLLYYCGAPYDLYYNFADGSFSIDSPLIDSGSLTYVKMLLPYEWIFNYCTDIKELKRIANLEKEYYEKMPTGLYNYLKEKSYALTAETLKKYVLHQKYGKYATFYKTLEQMIDRGHTEELINKIKIEELYKLFSNSLLNGELFDYSRYDFRDALNTIRIGVCRYNCSIDTNRGIGDNRDNVSSFLDENRKRIIEENMKKLNFINGLEIDDYVVVVPQTMEDKAEEGRMQNNCVGYYYDNSIMESRNAIYFLRKKENPEHSYITCRYNYEGKDTVEARKVNNSSIHDNKEWKIIKNISDIITEYFATHKE